MSRELPSGTTNFGEGEHDAPHLTLVPQTIFPDDLQLGVPLNVESVLDQRHWQRQARAQVVGMTYNLAASKAVMIVSKAIH